MCHTKNIKALMADLKRVYAAIDEDTALQELDRFDEIWGGNNPKSLITGEINGFI